MTFYCYLFATDFNNILQYDINEPNKNAVTITQNGVLLEGTYKSSSDAFIKVLTELRKIEYTLFQLEPSSNTLDINKYSSALNVMNSSNQDCAIVGSDKVYDYSIELTQVIRNIYQNSNTPIRFGNIIESELSDILVDIKLLTKLLATLSVEQDETIIKSLFSKIAGKIAFLQAVPSDIHPQIIDILSKNRDELDSANAITSIQLAIKISRELMIPLNEIRNRINGCLNN